jgi:hypothetical protein
MLKIRFIYVFLLFILSLVSCGKKELRDQKKELKRLEGKWNVDERTFETFDTLGNSLSFTTESNLGEMNFELSQDYSKNSSLYFNTVTFNPATFKSVYDYFSQFNAGDVIDGKFYCQWEADPDQKRILFWAIGPSSSYHISCDMEVTGNGKNKRMIKLITTTTVEILYISK